MKKDELHKDVHKVLLEDEKYQELLKTIENKEEKQQLEDFMKRLMNYFQENIFNPLTDKMENDQEFKDALSKKVDKLIPNSSDNK